MSYCLRKTKTYDSKIRTVTVPKDHDQKPEKTQTEETIHEEIQWLVLKLGSDLVLDVWVAGTTRAEYKTREIFRIFCV